MPRLFGKNYTRQQILDLVGDMSQVASLRRAELVEGNERGADLVEVNNASGLSFSVLPGRCLDIASASYQGKSLCFRSKTGDVGPAFYEPESFAWMRGSYLGLVTTCGLTFLGHPETDPEEENEELGLHGRISYAPAKSVSAEGRWEDNDYVIRIRGCMRETIMFGCCLELTREITTVLGEPMIRIHDRVENLGSDPSPLMIVYHTNPGWPLLDAGSRLVLDSRKSTEWTEDREVGPEEYGVARAPRQKAHDDVYVHRPRADRRGNINLALINDRLGLGLYYRFPRREIPIVNQWQHFHKGTYVTGIEPGNCSVLGRAWNRKHKTLQHIAPGEVRDFHIEMGVLDGAEQIRAWEKAQRR
ncbi:MAG: aldose 1-epimerase family protein [Candidatus Latescibacterota bacterium]|nr:aldose 1-epimerase family protein [Candidatus Latescibacterota bacterium]